MYIKSLDDELFFFQAVMVILTEKVFMSLSFCEKYKAQLMGKG